jgi:hypothetical protein
MSYWQAKAERDRALVAALHGEGDGTRRASTGVHVDSWPYVSPEPSLPLSGKPRELGWGDSVEVENGADLLFPWLGREDGRR